MDDWQADVPEEALVSCLECRCQCTVVRAFVEIACRGVCVCVLVFIICTRQWENKWEGRPVGGCVQAPGKEREKRLRACVTYVFVHPCVRCFGDKRSAQKGFRCNVHLSVSVHVFFFICVSLSKRMRSSWLSIINDHELQTLRRRRRLFGQLRNIRIVLIPEDGTFFL